MRRGMQIDPPSRGYAFLSHHAALSVCHINWEVGPLTCRPEVTRAEVQLTDEHAAQTGAVAFLVALLLLLLRKGLQHITQISDGKYGRGVESISTTRAFRVRGVSNCLCPEGGEINSGG